MNKAVLLAAACMLAAAPAYAQSGSSGKMNPPSRSPSVETQGAAPAGANAVSTEDFVKKAAISDMFEIQSSKLAERRGDKDAKKFGAKMVHDHGQTTAQLKSLVKSGKVQAQLPTSLDDEHQQKLAQLKSAKGADFNKSYDQMQQQAHQEAVEMFSNYAQSGDNPNLKKWAAKTLPHLKQHLSMAEKLK